MLQPFHVAIDRIYEAALNPNLWPQTLQSIADCFGDVGAILIYGRDDGGFGVIGSPSLARTVEEHAQGWSHRDTRANRFRERGYFLQSRVLSDSDILTEAEMAEDPFYTDFLARHGLKYFVAASLVPDRHVEVALSIQRRLGASPYTEDEKQLVDALSRHVERALRIGVQLLDGELVKNGLGEALSRLSVGVFALDSLNRIIFDNQSGRDLLGDGIEERGNRLHIVKPATRIEFEKAAKAQSPSGDADDWAFVSKPILVERQRTLRPLAVYLLPTSNALGEWAAFLGRTRCIAMIVDPDAHGPPDPTVIRDLLGLTMGEARVASLISAGESPREAAAKLNIAEETVRSVLKRVFDKMGVNRQSELASLMTRLIVNPPALNSRLQ